MPVAVAAARVVLVLVKEVVVLSSSSPISIGIDLTPFFEALSNRNFSGLWSGPEIEIKSVVLARRSFTFIDKIEICDQTQSA